MPRGYSVEFDFYQRDPRLAALRIWQHIRNLKSLKIVSVWENQVFVSDKPIDPDYEIVGYYQGTFNVEDMASDIRSSRWQLRRRMRGIVYEQREAA